jgi:hypothetical protein
MFNYSVTEIPNVTHKFSMFVILNIWNFNHNLFFRPFVTSHEEWNEITLLANRVYPVCLVRDHSQLIQALSLFKLVDCFSALWKDFSIM